MKKQISQAELEVMDILWRDGSIFSSDLAAELADKHKWTPQTVRTLLSRLVDKGVVSHERQGRRYLYSAMLEKSEFSKTATTRLIDTLFGGRAAPLLAQFVEDRGLKQDDIEEIETLLKKLKHDDE